MIDINELTKGIFKGMEENEEKRLTARFEGIEFVSYDAAFVKFYLPGVERKHVIVRVNGLDRLRGISIVEKAKRVAKKWEKKVEEINKEREWCKWASENIKLRDDQEW